MSQTTPTDTTDSSTTRVPWRGGWAAMPHTATRSTLPNTAYRVLGLLIGHMDLTTGAVHGQSAQRLAKELGWSTRTIERALATLRTTGWVRTYPDSAPYRLGWLVYVVQQEGGTTTELTEGVRHTCREDSAIAQDGVTTKRSYAGSPHEQMPTDASEVVRQEWRSGSGTCGKGGPTDLSGHDQDSGSACVEEDPPPVGDTGSRSALYSKLPSYTPYHRQEPRTATDRTDGEELSRLSAPPAGVSAPAPTDVTRTEALLLDVGFHPTTARSFRTFDLEAVRDALHTHDLLTWQPQDERNRRIGRLVVRWRQVQPERRREREVGASEAGPTAHPSAPPNDHSAPTQGDALLQDAGVCEEPLDPWTERARQVRPDWPRAWQNVLARALRHAPNDAAAVAMAQVTLGRAQRC